MTESSKPFIFYRSAHKKEILKAYRKLAVQWHPDKYDGDDKKKAEKMFLDIASAKEVLTNPGKDTNKSLCFHHRIFELWVSQNVACRKISNTDGVIRLWGVSFLMNSYKKY